MTTQAPQLLYMLDEDLYRLGNSTSPKLHNVRADDVNTYERNGVVMVVANGKGISLITEARLKRIEKVATGYVWKLPASERVLPPADTTYAAQGVRVLERNQTASFPSFAGRKPREHSPVRVRFRDRRCSATPQGG